MAASKRRLEDALITIEKALRMLPAEKLQEAFWADACPLLEHTLKMKRAEPHRAGQFLQRRLLKPVLVNVVKGLFDESIVPGRLHEVFGHSQTLGRPSGSAHPLLAVSRA